MAETDGAASLIALLRKAIAAFDGTSPTILGEAEAMFSSDRNYLDAVIVLCADEQSSVSGGATWLLKSACENGTRPTSGQAAVLIEGLPMITDWRAQLHLCQTLDAIPIASEALPLVSDWLRPLIDHQRPFVRAWAISAFCDLASEHEDLREDAKILLENAQQDPAASVRARVRKISLV